MAVKVLPEPVAICTRARGLSAFSDASRLSIALTWHSRRPKGFSGGSEAMPERKDRGASIQDIKVSGRWKSKTSRERGLGSRPLMNRVIRPVLS